MFFDEAHIKQADSTNSTGKKNFRATCWEIHPVTKLQVLD